MCTLFTLNSGTSSSLYVSFFFCSLNFVSGVPSKSRCTISDNQVSSRAPWVTIGAPVKMVSHLFWLCIGSLPSKETQCYVSAIRLLFIFNSVDSAISCLCFGWDFYVKTNITMSIVIFEFGFAAKVVSDFLLRCIGSMFLRRPSVYPPSCSSLCSIAVPLLRVARKREIQDRRTHSVCGHRRRKSS